MWFFRKFWWVCLLVSVCAFSEPPDEIFHPEGVRALKILYQMYPQLMGPLGAASDEEIIHFLKTTKPSQHPILKENRYRWSAPNQAGTQVRWQRAEESNDSEFFRAHLLSQYLLLNDLGMVRFGDLRGDLKLLSELSEKRRKADEVETFNDAPNPKAYGEIYRNAMYALAPLIYKKDEKARKTNLLSVYSEIIDVTEPSSLLMLPELYDDEYIRKFQRLSPGAILNRDFVQKLSAFRRVSFKLREIPAFALNLKNLNFVPSDSIPPPEFHSLNGVNVFELERGKSRFPVVVVHVRQGGKTLPLVFIGNSKETNFPNPDSSTSARLETQDIQAALVAIAEQLGVQELILSDRSQSIFPIDQIPSEVRTVKIQDFPKGWLSTEFLAASGQHGFHADEISSGQLVSKSLLRGYLPPNLTFKAANPRAATQRFFFENPKIDIGAVVFSRLSSPQVLTQKREEMEASILHALRIPVEDRNKAEALGLYLEEREVANPELAGRFSAEEILALAQYIRFKFPLKRQALIAAYRLKYPGLQEFNRQIAAEPDSHVRYHTYLHKIMDVMKNVPDSPEKELLLESLLEGSGYQNQERFDDVEFWKSLFANYSETSSNGRFRRGVWDTFLVSRIPGTNKMVLLRDLMVNSTPSYLGALNLTDEEFNSALELLDFKLSQRLKVKGIQHILLGRLVGERWPPANKIKLVKMLIRHLEDFSYDREVHRLKTGLLLDQILSNLAWVSPEDFTILLSKLDDAERIQKFISEMSRVHKGSLNEYLIAMTPKLNSWTQGSYSDRKKRQWALRSIFQRFNGENWQPIETYLALNLSEREHRNAAATLAEANLSSRVFDNFINYLNEHPELYESAKTKSNFVTEYILNRVTAVGENFAQLMQLKMTPEQAERLVKRYLLGSQPNATKFENVLNTLFSMNDGTSETGGKRKAVLETFVTDVSVIYPEVALRLLTQKLSFSELKFIMQSRARISRPSTRAELLAMTEYISSLNHDAFEDREKFALVQANFFSTGPTQSTSKDGIDYFQNELLSKIKDSNFRKALEQSRNSMVWQRRKENCNHLFRWLSNPTNAFLVGGWGGIGTFAAYTVKTVWEGSRIENRRNEFKVISDLRRSKAFYYLNEKSLGKLYDFYPGRNLSEDEARFPDGVAKYLEEKNQWGLTRLETLKKRMLLLERVQEVKFVHGNFERNAWFERINEEDPQKLEPEIAILEKTAE